MSQKVLVIGCGNMGKALLKGFASSEAAAKVTVEAYDRHPLLMDEVQKIKGVTPLTTIHGDANAIVLCVKPQDLGSVADSLKGKLDPNKSMLISIAAGTSIASLESQFNFQGAVVRAMPNIAATVGEAATAMAANRHCTEDQKALTENLFNSIGKADWIAENLLDAVTGLSGSGPAYLYMVIEALTDGGVKMGIPRNLSLKLATQTVLGSAKLVQETGLHPAVLRDQVTTPGGTTISAIHELEAHGLRAMLISAVATATEKSAELNRKKS